MKMVKEDVEIAFMRNARTSFPTEPHNSIPNNKK